MVNFNRRTAANTYNIYMGDHYVPQFYLRNFSAENDDKTIWVYSLSGQKPFRTSIKNIAQERNFYSREIEKHLAEEIEPNASAIIRKICDGNFPNADERIQLANFMNILLRRVPKHKEVVEKMIPDVLSNVLEGLNSDLERAIEENPSLTQLANKRREEAMEYLESYAASDTIVEDMWMEGIVSNELSQIATAISKMTWIIAVTPSRAPFITSDNPFFHFANIGIGKPQSEISFPISRNLALWGTWRTDLKEGFYRYRNQFVKEVNRRTASNSAKYLFSSENSSWISKLALKKSFRLTRII